MNKNTNHFNGTFTGPGQAAYGKLNPSQDEQVPNAEDAIATQLEKVVGKVSELVDSMQTLAGLYIKEHGPDGGENYEKVSTETLHRRGHEIAKAKLGLLQSLEAVELARKETAEELFARAGSKEEAFFEFLQYTLNRILPDSIND